MDVYRLELTEISWNSVALGLSSGVTDYAANIPTDLSVHVWSISFPVTNLSVPPGISWGKMQIESEGGSRAWASARQPRDNEIKDECRRRA